jgi:hypothetical protein
MASRQKQVVPSDAQRGQRQYLSSPRGSVVVIERGRLRVARRHSVLERRAVSRRRRIPITTAKATYGMK